MEIPLTFHGGPLDKVTALTNSLDEVKLFFDERNRQVFCYRRLFESVYTLDRDRSAKLTLKFDEAKEKLWTRGGKVRFANDPLPLPDDQLPNPAKEKPLREKGKWVDSDILKDKKADEPADGDML